MYKSRLDSISVFNPEDFSYFKEYGSGYRALLQDTSDAISCMNNKKLVLHSARIIRALLDFKIKKEIPDISPYLVESVNLALKFFDSSYEGEELSNYLGRFVNNTQALDGLLECDVIQHYDLTTQCASMPNYTEKTFDRVKRKFEGESLLIISLAHGSTIPGIDLYGRMINSGFDVMMYPVRFSRMKLDDKFPRVSQSEKDYLKKQDRNVLVFEEDCCTGITTDKAVDYFSNLFQRKVYSEVNLDARS